MGNLSAREKFGVYAIVAILAFVVLWMAVLKPMRATHDELELQKNTLEEQIRYYDTLITQNENSENEIQLLNGDISELELSFLPVLNTQCLQQYVLATFEDNGCPYLVSIDSTDIPGVTVLLPDGTTSNDSVVINRVTVKYASTDGFNIPQYNRENSVLDEANAVDEAAFAENVDSIGAVEMPIVGYDEFLAALEEIASVSPDTIKVDNIIVESESGYLLLTASIDFYALRLTDRVSTADLSAPYISWSGETPATGVGIIGYPLKPVEDTASAWCNILMTDGDATIGSRPFATYYSTAIFNNLVANNTLQVVVGFEAQEAATPDDATPDDGDGEVA